MQVGPPESHRRRELYHTRTVGVLYCTTHTAVSRRKQTPDVESRSQLRAIYSDFISDISVPYLSCLERLSLSFRRFLSGTSSQPRRKTPKRHSQSTHAPPSDSPHVVGRRLHTGANAPNIGRHREPFHPQSHRDHIARSQRGKDEPVDCAWRRRNQVGRARHDGVACGARPLLPHCIESSSHAHPSGPARCAQVPVKVKIA